MAILDYAEKKVDRHNDLKHITNKSLRHKINLAFEQLGGRYASARRTLNGMVVKGIYKNKDHFIKLFKSYLELENVYDLEEEYDLFVENTRIKGLQTGTLTPILSYLQPKLFCTYNGPVADALRKYLPKNLKKHNYCRLENYIFINGILYKIREKCRIETFANLDHRLAIIAPKKKK